MRKSEVVSEGRTDHVCLHDLPSAADLGALSDPLAAISALAFYSQALCRGTTCPPVTTAPSTSTSPTASCSSPWCTPSRAMRPQRGSLCICPAMSVCRAHRPTHGDGRQDQPLSRSPQLPKTTPRRCTEPIPLTCRRSRRPEAQLKARNRQRCGTLRRSSSQACTRKAFGSFQSEVFGSFSGVFFVSRYFPTFGNFSSSLSRPSR